jgi:hypothetical protein
MNCASKNYSNKCLQHVKKLKTEQKSWHWNVMGPYKVKAWRGEFRKRKSSLNLQRP